MAKGDNLGEFEQLVILAILRTGGSAYGMEVRQEIERTTGRVVTIGAVYGTLERLEEKRMLASHRKETGAEAATGQGRRFFTVERAGLESLARARETLARMWEGVDVPLPGNMPQ